MATSGWKERSVRYLKQARSLLFVVLVVLSFRSSIADWNDVPTGSMKPNILEGDRIFVNKLAYDLKVPFTTWHIAEWTGDPGTTRVARFLLTPEATPERGWSAVYGRITDDPEAPIFVAGGVEIR